MSNSPSGESKNSINDRNNNDSVQKHTPPIKGEYGYYDHRLNLRGDGNWIIEVIESNTNSIIGPITCHYSMRMRMTNVPFITCNGLIHNVYHYISGNSETIN